MNHQGWPSDLQSHGSTQSGSLEHSRLTHPGTYFIGRYRIVDEIGVGGMASVHLARVDGAGGVQKWVAIKRIHQHLVQDEQVVKMFMDEARIAASISHPNVAQVFDVGSDNNVHWLAMEYLHGEPLREVLRYEMECGNLMDPALATRIVAEAAEGLHAAHELRGQDGNWLNLVHRDVTPHNLFVTYDGVVKVVDFGIAKVAHRLSETQAGTLKGKIAYMAPEQAAGRELDRRTDIFSLGVVLWELLTGMRLFRMESDLETYERVRMCQVPSPSTILAGFPQELDEIVMKALRKDPAQRFQTAREFSRALNQFLVHSGRFIGAEEKAGYLSAVFGDRIAQRNAYLKLAAQVTKTMPPSEAMVGAAVPHGSSPSRREEDDAPTVLESANRFAGGKKMGQGDRKTVAEAHSGSGLRQAATPGVQGFVARPSPGAFGGPQQQGAAKGVGGVRRPEAAADVSAADGKAARPVTKALVTLVKPRDSVLRTAAGAQAGEVQSSAAAGVSAARGKAVRPATKAMATLVQHGVAAGAGPGGADAAFGAISTMSATAGLPSSPFGGGGDDDDDATLILSGDDIEVDDEEEASTTIFQAHHDVLAAYGVQRSNGAAAGTSQVSGQTAGQPIAQPVEQPTVPASVLDRAIKGYMPPGTIPDQVRHWVTELVRQRTVSAPASGTASRRGGEWIAPGVSPAAVETFVGPSVAQGVAPPPPLPALESSTNSSFGDNALFELSRRRRKLVFLVVGAAVLLVLLVIVIVSIW